MIPNVFQIISVIVIMIIIGNIIVFILLEAIHDINYWKPPHGFIQ